MLYTTTGILQQISKLNGDFNYKSGVEIHRFYFIDTNRLLCYNSYV